MTREYIPIDISNAPDLKRLAEAVRQSGKPHALQEGMETLAVVRPAPKTGGAQVSLRSEVSPMNDPAFMKLLEDDLRANREAPVDRATLFAPPAPEQTVKRKAILAQIEAHLPQRVITPLTAADLIEEVRAQEEDSGRGC